MSKPTGALLTCLHLAAAAVGLASAAVAAAPSDADWPMYGRDFAGTRFSPLTEIDASNVGRLALAWSVPVARAADDKSDAPGDNGNPQATPIVVDGVMYLPARGNEVLALDAATGEVRWRATLPAPLATTARGVAYWPGERDSPATHPADRGADARRARRAHRRARGRLRPRRHRRDRRAVEWRADDLQERRDPRRDDGRSAARGARRYARVRRAHRREALGVPHGAAAGRARPRHVARRRLEEPLGRERLGLVHDASTRSAASLYMPVGGPGGELLGRRSSRQQPLRATRSSRSMRRPASTAGTSRPCITISGIRTCRRRRCSWTSCRTAGAIPALASVGKTG